MDDERIRVPRRSLGLRSFQNGLSIRTSTSLLCEDTGMDRLLPQCHLGHALMRCGKCLTHNIGHIRLDQEIWSSCMHAFTTVWCAGGDVWRGAIALAKYLEEDLHDAVFGKRILELGAGTGLLGLSLALAGAHEVNETEVAEPGWLACFRSHLTWKISRAATGGRCA
jgi:hypothetical protein